MQGRFFVATSRRRSAPQSLRSKNGSLALGIGACRALRDHAKIVSPANTGLTCRPPLIAAMAKRDWQGRCTTARARGDHMAAIDQALAEAALGFGELVEMDPRGVVIEPRRHHVLGFFDGACRRYGRSSRRLRSRPSRVLAAEFDRLEHARNRAPSGATQVVWRHDALPASAPSRPAAADVRIALAHHHPAHEGDGLVVHLVEAFGADIDDAGLAVGVLP